MPIWWRWYYWGTPVAHTLYGMITSQFGDIEERMDTGQTVVEFLRDHFGYEHDMVGPVAAALLGFVVLSLFMFAFSIKAFNFQRR